MAYQDGQSHPTVVTISANTVTLVLAANPKRHLFHLQNSGSVDIYWHGSASVSNTGATKGFLLSGGLTPPAEWADPYRKGAIYAFATSSTSLVVDEVYNDAS